MARERTEQCPRCKGVGYFDGTFPWEDSDDYKRCPDCNPHPIFPLRVMSDYEWNKYTRDGFPNQETRNMLAWYYQKVRYDLKWSLQYRITFWQRVKAAKKNARTKFIR